jgi:acyl-CoA synthetase (AMP-forming)/AMP-acid ligase II
MMTAPESTTYDRAALRDLWYREGFYSDRSLPDILIECCIENASTSVVFANADGTSSSTTVGEIHSAAGRVASALQGLGVRSGDAVAVQLPNCVETTIAYEAVLLTGAVLVPIVHIYGPNEVRFILEESGAKVLVQPHRWRSVDYGHRVTNYRDVPTLEQIVTVGDTVPDGALAWTTLVSTADEYIPPSICADDVALLIYTSGTTSAPKGVQHSHNSIMSEQRSAPQVLGSGKDSVQLVSFPPGHIAGVGSVLRPFVHGQDVVYMETWDPARAVELIARYRVTATSGTPFHLSGMLDLGDDAGAFATLREFLIGAATVPEDLVRRAAAVGISTYRCYGSTEQPTITSGAATDPEAVRLGTDGAPLPGVQVRIIDVSGGDLPAGTDGEVVTRGPDQFVGYRDESLNPSAFTEDGWMRTGDLGHLDVDGRLTITDRIKDVVIRAGETISSGQLEDILVLHPAVLEGAIVAAPDPRYGEVVAAVVVLAPGARLDLDDVRVHFSSSGLAKQKTPERLVIVDALPRTPLGKIRKADLRLEHFS